MPAPLLAEHRAAAALIAAKPVSRVGLAVIIALSGLGLANVDCLASQRRPCTS